MQFLWLWNSIQCQFLCAPLLPVPELVQSNATTCTCTHVHHPLSSRLCLHKKMANHEGSILLTVFTLLITVSGDIPHKLPSQHECGQFMANNNCFSTFFKRAKWILFPLCTVSALSLIRSIQQHNIGNKVLHDKRNRKLVGTRVAFYQY